MKTCDNKYEPNVNLDHLSDEAFEDFLKHTDSCSYHSRLLDEYNGSLVPLFEGAVQENILPTKLVNRTVIGIWGRLIAFKLRNSIPGLNEQGSLSVTWFALGSVLLAGTGVFLATIVSRNPELANLSVSIAAILATVGFIFATFRWVKSPKLISSGEHGVNMLYSQQFEGTKLIHAKDRQQPSNLSDKEKEISAEVKKITKPGFNSENCQKALDFLDANTDIVKGSWMNTLNRARLTRGTGKRKEALQIVRDVMDEFSHSREAIGSAYKVLAWFEELEYIEGNMTDSQKLDQRMEYIRKGLQFYPEYYLLWIDGFEIACLKKDALDAVFYLEELIKVDRDAAEEYLAGSTFKEEIRLLGLDRKIKNSKMPIGINVMKHFKSKKIRNLISVLILSLSLVPIFYGEIASAQAQGMNRSDADGLQNTIAQKTPDGLQFKSAKAVADGLQDKRTKSADGLQK